MEQCIHCADAYYLLEKLEEMAFYISLKVIRHILKKQLLINSSGSSPIEPLSLSHPPTFVEQSTELVQPNSNEKQSLRGYEVVNILPYIVWQQSMAHPLLHITLSQHHFRPPNDKHKSSSSHLVKSPFVISIFSLEILLMKCIYLLSRA